MKTLDIWKTIQTGYDLTLPSGAHVKVKTFSLAEYLESKKLPNALQKIAVEVFTTGGFRDIQNSIAEDINFVNYVISKSLLEPTAGINTSEKADVLVKEIPWKDRFAIYMSVINPVKENLGFLFETNTIANRSTPSPDDTDSAPQT